MDAVMLNRLGIAIELAGTLLAAPEVVDRLVGIARLEAIAQRVMRRLRSFAEGFLTTRQGRMAGGAAAVTLVDYLIVYVTILLLSGNPVTHAQLSWWWPWRLLAALPAVLIAAIVVGVVLSVWFQAVRKVLQSSGLKFGAVKAVGLSLALTVAVPLILAYLAVVCLAVPAILPASAVVRRLKQGWLRLTLLGLGVPLFVSGLSMQFLATF